ncbi:hypothetical protein TrLO_g7479 [Triparma laevis f. longispina]|uniref:Uncharacterized protein n=1 Tax=Triparma laevis f. longispina TaxID=1714387 RepID=A0A9W7FG58_9STRA|nr:hypothetical protein TrLO_g7479 [Triparma laevis f. longispina]
MTLKWCSPQDYSTLGLTLQASAKVHLTYYESPTSTVELYTRTYLYNFLTGVTKGDHSYSVELPQLDDYMKISAQLKRQDQCQQLLTSISNSATSEAGPPTWYTSNNRTKLAWIFCLFLVM